MMCRERVAVRQWQWVGDTWPVVSVPLVNQLRPVSDGISRRQSFRLRLLKPVLNNLKEDGIGVLSDVSQRIFQFYRILNFFVHC